MNASGSRAEIVQAAMEAGKLQSPAHGLAEFNESFRSGVLQLIAELQKDPDGDLDSICSRVYDRNFPRFDPDHTYGVSEACVTVKELLQGGVVRRPQRDGPKGPAKCPDCGNQQRLLVYGPPLWPEIVANTGNPRTDWECPKCGRKW